MNKPVGGKNDPILIFRCRIPEWAGHEHLLGGLAKIPSRLHPEIIRFIRVQDQLARLVARRLISLALEASSLGEFTNLDSWQKDSLGRPFLRGSLADISVSHSGRWVVSSLATNCRVGIDVEIYRPLDLESIRSYLSVSETEKIEKAEDPSREGLRCWSLREALLKAEGCGLMASNQEIRDILKTEKSQGGRWRISHFEVIPGACLYLATDQDKGDIVHQEWDFQDLFD